MAWKTDRSLKQPTCADIAKGVDHWRNAEQIARNRLANADNCAARQRQCDRIDFCRAAYAEASKAYVENVK